MKSAAARRFGALLFSVALVAGCGQKGPLYLPQQDTPNQEEPAEQGNSDD